ncbi:MAG TPA: hypothetical protein VLB09_08400, partial [Nitrospiria bacterium]|nr:hypothetical protein [Nitrospiria bacterium]
MKSVSSQIEKALTGEFIELFPDEAALKLEGLSPAEIILMFRDIRLPQAVALLSRFTPTIGSEIIRRMEPDFARKILSALDPVRAARLLPLLKQEEIDGILTFLDPSRARILRSFLSYPADRA